MIYDELPIYQHGCALLQLALEIQAQLPRVFRRSMGDKIHALCMDILEDMAMANAARGAQRVAALDQLLMRLRATVAMLRVGHEMRAPQPIISHKLWARSVELTDAIGQQAGGWRKDAIARASAPTSSQPAGQQLTLGATLSPAA